MSTVSIIKNNKNPLNLIKPDTVFSEAALMCIKLTTRLGDQKLCFYGYYVSLNKKRSVDLMHFPTSYKTLLLLLT